MKKPIHVYTDGGNYQDKLSAWGFIAIDETGIIHQDSGILVGEICSIWNIGAEIKATEFAVTWAKNNGHQLVINHDLLGLSKWAYGDWKRKNKWTKEFYNFIQTHLEYIVEFRHCRGHSGDYYNEMVDKLVTKTLKDNWHKHSPKK